MALLYTDMYRTMPTLHALLLVLMGFHGTNHKIDPSRRPVVCTLQLPEVSAAAEGQERDLEEGFTNPQRRPQIIPNV